jgi:hypothetical protein
MQVLYLSYSNSCTNYVFPFIQDVVEMNIKQTGWKTTILS